MSAQFATVLALTLEKFFAALVDRMVKRVKEEAARDKLEKAIADSRTARTQQEAGDAAEKIRASF